MSLTDGSDPHWWAICLCAEWCHVCREWRETFSQAAAAYPEIRFAWVDVEDEAEAMGDLDIETFPTLLIARDDQPFFLGPIQPSGSQLTRLIASLTQGGDRAPGLPEQARDLLKRLHATVLPN
jgi:thioredoxin 1